MTETWFGRDFPVLRAVVHLVDTDIYAQPSDVAKMTGLERGDALAAMRALQHGGYVALAPTFSDLEYGTVEGASGRARELVGHWPTPKSLAEEMVILMEKQAETETDPHKRKRIKSFVKETRNAGREVAVDVLASVIKQQMGV
ncbi:hypothetical protein [Nocardiopsis coralliicola]